ncbi:MAG: hypothetical protein PGN22_03105 [Agrobacterium cavarae]
MSDSTSKRWRVPTPKPGVLEAKYGKDESYNRPSIVYVHGGAGSSRPDARLLSTVFEGTDISTGKPIFGEVGRSFVKELEDRGYDITTLRFSIKLKATQP